MTASNLILSEFLPYQLAVISSRISKRLSVIYEQRYDLTMPEWRVLVHLAQSTKLSVREICTYVDLDKPSVSRAVSRLETAGFVEKVTSAADQRLVEVSLTEEGRSALKAIIPDALTLETRLLQNFSARQISDFGAMLEMLHSELDLDPDAVSRPNLAPVPAK